MIKYRSNVFFQDKIKVIDSTQGNGDIFGAVSNSNQRASETDDTYMI